MQSQRFIARYISLFSVVFLLVAGTFGLFSLARENAEMNLEGNQSVLLPDQPLAAFQIELLNLAFRTGSSIPIHPHIKDRSRTQEQVVEACLILDQPQRVLPYIEQIDDWRRGSCYAELAIYYAQRGSFNTAQEYLDRAVHIVEVGLDDGKLSGAESQEWRRDRVLIKVAQTQVYLGNLKQAEELEENVVESEMGKVIGVRASLSDEETFDQQMQELDELIAQGHFDVLNNALRSCTQLFKRFYHDEIRRSQVEDKIKTAWQSIPSYVRLRLLFQLIEIALEQSDLNKALELVNEAQDYVDNYQYPPENWIPLKAELAGLRHRAGDTQKAQSDADAAFTFFETERDRIVNIYRAGALRPLAEAYQRMGETQTALLIYKRAIEEGMDNPNSRPRAEDLAANLISMAIHGVEPDEQLWNRVQEIHRGLGQPW